jgi:hypothetical protein
VHHRNGSKSSFACSPSPVSSRYAIARISSNRSNRSAC